MNPKVHTIRLPWDAPPLSLNARLHHMAEAKLTREIRQTAAALADDDRVGAFTRPSVTLVWLVTDRYRRDADNVVPTLKALCDGLVDAGVATDDTPERMHKAMPIIAYAKGHPTAPAMYLCIWEAGPATPDELRALSEVGL